MDFKSFLTHKNVNLFIMEIEENNEKYIEDPYVIYELTEKELDSANFENLIADKIESCIRTYSEFRGFVIYKSKQFMVFKQKDIENA